MPRIAKRNGQVTIREVATHALVSIGTASRVFNNHPNVEEGLRVRVLAAANELGYTHRLRERANSYNFHDDGKRPRINHVAFCCRAGLGSVNVVAQNPYFSLVLHGAEAECRNHKMHLLYQVFEDDAHYLDRVFESLKKSGAEALILVNFTSERLVGGLLELNLPAVLIDHYFPELPLDVVMNENYSGSMRVMEYLIGKGHRRIGFLDGLAHYTIKQRRAAYRTALDNGGLSYDPELVVTGDLTIEGGVRAAQEVVRRGLDATAFFCANDTSAIGFIQGLNAAGWRVPEDISVVGFDDIEAAKIISPPLTTVQTNADQLGRMAVRRLLDRIKDPTLPVTQTLLQSTLVERHSVRNLS